MYILGINGSPHKKGNVSFLIELALKAASEKGAQIEMIHVHEVMKEQEKPYCDACSSPCNKSCFEGTSLEEVFEKVKKADAIVMGSPVYFGTVSAQLKAFWDKTRWLRSEKSLIGKVGGAIAVGATRFGGQETTLRTLHDMMLIHGMSIVAEGTKGTDAGHQGVCGVKPVQEDTFAQERAKILGWRLVEEVSSRK